MDIRAPDGANNENACWVLVGHYVVVVVAIFVLVGHDVRRAMLNHNTNKNTNV